MIEFSIIKLIVSCNLYLIYDDMELYAFSRCGAGAVCVNYF